MGSNRKTPSRLAAEPKSGTAGDLPGTGSIEPIVVVQLADSFTLARSESEWLLTLLSAEELRYIFEGPTDDKIQD